ncbi:MAG: hypothetical protein RIC16_11495 [Rhodospirillales bacterium]
MFGFSISKLLFTIVAIAAIWYGFKFIKRVQDREDDSVSQRRRPGVGSANRTPADRDDDDVETMIECRTCGSFVAASGARSCGREDCPYPG